MIIIMIFLTIGCEKTGEGNIAETLEEDTRSEIDYEPEYGGQLVLPLTTIDTLNPLASENKTYYHFSKLIFEGLFELDSDLNITNVLAEDYTIKEDGSISIKLKDDVLWHDGTKLTTEDVAFTINTIKSGNNHTTYKKVWSNMLGGFNFSNINRIIDTYIIDDNNIDIVFDKNYSQGLEMLTFPIIPKHQFVMNREDKSAYVKALSDEEYIPIGTGPYEFVEHRKNKDIKLKYNEEYREGRPYIDEIIGKIFEDEELILMGFETGQVDLTIALDEEWEKYEQSNVRTLEFVSEGYEFLGFNFSRRIFNGEEGEGLRKAIAYGIDRQAIIQNVYSGHATQSDLPIHPNSWLLSNEANAYGYSLAKAREYIEGLGWKDVNGDGYYEDQNGNEVALKLLTNSYNPLRLKAADMIVEDFDKMGIRIVKDYTEIIPDNITEEMVDAQWEEINKKISRGDFDILLTGWNLSPAQELSFAFHSSQIKSGTNFIRYNNPIMDEALVEAFSESNRDNKLRSYEKLQKIITKDLPYISLYFKNNALLLDRKVMGEIDPCFYNLYRNIETWYIPKEFH